jgi:hypothetical protein
MINKQEINNILLLLNRIISKVNSLEIDTIITESNNFIDNGMFYLDSNNKVKYSDISNINKYQEYFE